DDGLGNDVGRPVHEPGPDEGDIDVDGREQHAAAGDGQVPVAGDVDVAARRPAVVGGDPDVAGLDAAPVAGPPDVAAVVPGPGAGDVQAVRRGWLAGVGHGRRRRRRGQVRDRLVAGAVGG